LTSFSFAVSSLTSFYHTKEYIRELVAMLQRCIKLQDLELMLAHDIPSDLQPLFQGRWPLLKKFLLGGSGRRSSSVRIPLSSKVDVQSFFDAHPTIEVLYLNVHLENWPKRPVDVNGLTAASYGIDSLPNLEFLHVAQNVFSLISPATIMPKLKHIRLVEIEPVQLPFFRELGPGLVNLTSIWMVLHSSITISDIKPFFACIPQVKSLFMRGNPPEPWVPIVRMPPDFYREAVPMSIPIVVWALPQVCRGIILL
jgi:hypothetical protein